jgi:hypothetical protein
VSGHAAGLDIDLTTALDPASTGDAGVPAGAELMAYADAVHRGTSDLADVRDAVESALGTDALHEAAAIVAIFNGLVRVADGTGIQLDEGVVAESADYRDELGVNAFAGVANTPSATRAALRRPFEVSSIRALYS